MSSWTDIGSWRWYHLILIWLVSYVIIAIVAVLRFFFPKPWRRFLLFPRRPQSLHDYWSIFAIAWRGFPVLVSGIVVITCALVVLSGCWIVDTVMTGVKR